MLRAFRREGFRATRRRVSRCDAPTDAVTGIQYLVKPLLAEIIRLALDTQSRNSKHQVTFVDRGSPLQRGIDNALVDAGNVMHNTGDVGAVDVHRVDVWIAVGHLVYERQVLKLLRQVVKGRFGRHVDVASQGSILMKLAAGWYDAGALRGGFEDGETRVSSRCSKN